MIVVNGETVVTGVELKQVSFVGSHEYFCELYAIRVNGDEKVTSSLDTLRFRK